MNTITNNPAILITLVLYCIGKYILMFSFTKPSTFRIRHTCFDCLFSFATRWAGWRVMVIILFFRRTFPMFFIAFHLQQIFKKQILLSHTFLYIFIICPGSYMSRIYKDLTWSNQFKFMAFLQYIRKYLIEEVGILKTTGGFFPNGEKWWILSFTSRQKTIDTLYCLRFSLHSSTCSLYHTGIEWMEV